MLLPLLMAITALDVEPPSRGFVSRQPAQTWENALVSGNGRHGAMVMGQPLDETIILNHARLYLPLHQPLPPVDTSSHLTEIRQLLADRRYQDAADLVVELSKREGYGGKRWTDPFIPACDLRLRMAERGAVRDYQRSVDFMTGVAAVRWSDERGAFRRRLFVSRADDQIVLSLDGPAGQVDCDLSLAQRPTQGVGGWNPGAAFRDGIKDVRTTAAGGLLTYESTFRRTWPGSLTGYQVVARVMARGGESRAEGDRIVVRGADAVLVTARVILDGTATPAPTGGYGFDDLLARHTPLHGESMSRMSLDLGGGADRALASEDLLARTVRDQPTPALTEKVFDAARYAVISASGELFPNLQGLWTGTWAPPWSGDFTLNGNVQSAIAADLCGNLAECLLPFFDYLEAHLPEFRENAQRLYGCRGIHVPSRASTHGYNNHFDGTWPMTFWTAGAAWAAQFYYDYYLYTGDRAFLRDRALPFMREAALFYEDFLQPGADGKLHFSPSYSPENNPANSPSQACVDAAMDIGAARELLGNLIAACCTLGVRADEVARWRGMLDRLVDYRVNAAGGLAEWATPDLDDNDAHRHCSHLYEVYNGLPDDIAANPALRRAFEVALDRRMAVRRREFAGESFAGRPPGEMAFGLVFEGLSGASLRQPRVCGEVIDWLTSRYWRPNLVSTHNPDAIFNTDICGGLPAVIIRSLVDSQPGWIELLPALSPRWPSGSLRGARCRGQVALRELTWRPEAVTVTLRSDIDQALELRCGASRRRVTLAAGKDQTVTMDRRALTNPVWATPDNLRDPSVYRVDDGYHLFYSRFRPPDWTKAESWTIGHVFTRDWRTFEDDRDISPPGHASPGDLVRWQGRWVLPYQSYPTKPTQLVFSESTDLRAWSAPKPFLVEALDLPWNTYHRVIDPTFVVDGDTLHCWFVGSADVTAPDGRKLRANLLGHATTQDPRLERWTITSVDQPLIGASPQAPDGVENVMVYRTGQVWTMLYSEGLADQHLALANSTDLRHWTMHGPVAIERQKWMARKYGAPFVWPEGDRWRMILMGENAQGRTTFGLLDSPDGRAWNLLPEE